MVASIREEATFKLHTVDAQPWFNCGSMKTCEVFSVVKNCIGGRGEGGHARVSCLLLFVFGSSYSFPLIFITYS